MKRLVVLVAAATLSSSAIAQETGAYYGDNHVWDVVCTPDGYELTSRYPVSRHIKGSTQRPFILERQTLLLDKNCRAHRNTFKGKWCWTNSGFVALFADYCIRFPHYQELGCPDGSVPEYDLACACTVNDNPSVDDDPLCR